MKTNAKCAIRCIMMSFLAYASTCVQLDAKSYVSQASDFEFKMSLKVPRVYDNTESLGYRKFQRQSISGILHVTYDEEGYVSKMSFSQLVNSSHKLSSGKNVTYKAYVQDDTTPLLNAIGSNKTGKFNTATVKMSLAAEPNYNIGPFDEDTSLFLTLAGSGRIDSRGMLKLASGYAAGTLGCGCFYYGHISPTRKIWLYGISSIIDDVAAVYGTWKMKAVR